ncbi:MAG: hypothetical protein KDK33_13755 [Leptospiraceae bacterium]|nr:hypothetical protein [Leptospiraceae bacterium]
MKPLTLIVPFLLFTLQCSTLEKYWNRWNTDLESVIIQRSGLRKTAKFLMVPLEPRNVELGLVNANNLTDNLRFELEDQGVRTIPMQRIPQENQSSGFDPGIIAQYGADFAITGYVFHIMTGSILEEEDSVGVMVRIISKEGKEAAFVRFIGKGDIDSFEENARAAHEVAGEIVTILE